MKPITNLLFALALLTTSLSAHAEGGCPPGQFPQQGQGWRSCIPVSGVGTPPSTYETSPQWQPYWGAIATDGRSGKLGSAEAKLTQEIAERAAIESCRMDGGKSCRVSTSYSSGCGVLTVGEKGFATASGPTEDAAERTSMIKCQADGDKKCYVYFKTCSIPPNR
jgi:hypothetical protein